MKHIIVVCKDTSCLDARWYKVVKLMYLAVRHCGGIAGFRRSNFTD